MELLFVTVIVWILVPSIFSIYTFIARSNKEISARQTVIQQWYEFFERLNILMQDYTIDYEEYYNRQMVWCVAWWLTWSSFKRNVWMSGYCTAFTAYGNENSTNRKTWTSTQRLNSWYHDIYYCSENTSQDKFPYSKVVEQNQCWKVWTRQSFGQYKALFMDVWKDTDKDVNIIWDSDDFDLGSAINDINAVMDEDNVQELYLISHDGKSRLFFRRKLIKTHDQYAQYKIQMLRLRWFDAGQKHNLDNTSDNPWLYDWVIDTWTCDAWMWFERKWDSIGWAYPEYKLPKDADDCWVDLTHWSATITARNLQISPVSDPDLYRAEQDRQINPYIKILTVNGVYPPYYWKLSDSIVDFKLPLQTTINVKSFYQN